MIAKKYSFRPSNDKKDTKFVEAARDESTTRNSLQQLLEQHEKGRHDRFLHDPQRQTFDTPDQLVRVC